MAITEKLKTIADAIRLKRDISDEMTLEDMAMQIGLIDGGGTDLKRINVLKFTPSEKTGTLYLEFPNAPIVGIIYKNTEGSESVIMDYFNFMLNEFLSKDIKNEKE